MVNVLSFSFEQCFGPFTMLVVKGSSETGLFTHYLTTLLGVRKFKNTLAMTVIFFKKIFKMQKNYKIFFRF